MLRNHGVALATGLAIALTTYTTTASGQNQNPNQGFGQNQAGPGSGGLMGLGGNESNPVMLLLAPSVQKELKLSDEAKGKAFSLAQSANQKGRDLMRSMFFGGGNGNLQAMMDAGTQLRQENDKAIAKILDPQQQERLNQISLRVEGPLALARPEIASRLRLNQNQSAYVQDVMIQMRTELFMAMRQGAQAGGINPGQIRTMTTQLRESAVQEISKFIDAKQKAAFNKMLGEPFDITKIQSETAAIDPTADSSSSKPADAPDSPDASASAADPGKPAEPAKVPQRPALKKSRTKSKTGSTP